MAVAEDGCIFLAADDTLTAIEPGGHTRWRHRAEGRVGAPAVLANGVVLVTEDDGKRLAARDQVTGKAFWRAAGEWSTRSPDVLPNGDILVQNWGDPAKIDVYLFCLTPEGRERWRYRLGWLGNSVLTLPDTIVAADGSYLAGLNFEGERLWRASRHGFISEDKAPPSLVVEHENFCTPPMYVESAKVLIGASWWEGRGILAFDIERRTVRPLDNKSGPVMPSRPPLALPAAPEPRIAGGWAAELAVFDLLGNLVFERRLPRQITDVLADAAGNIVVSTSVGRKYWLNYRDAYRLHDVCGLTCFDPSGNMRFRWVAPGPVTSPLAVGKEGELYCRSEGQLFAIG